MATSLNDYMKKLPKEVREAAEKRGQELIREEKRLRNIKEVIIDMIDCINDPETSEDDRVLARYTLKEAIDVATTPRNV